MAPLTVKPVSYTHLVCWAIRKRKRAESRLVPEPKTWFAGRPEIFWATWVAMSTGLVTVSYTHLDRHFSGKRRIQVKAISAGKQTQCHSSVHGLTDRAHLSTPPFFMLAYSPSYWNSISSRAGRRHFILLHKEFTNLRGDRTCRQTTKTALRVLQHHRDDKARIVRRNNRRIIADNRPVSYTHLDVYKRQPLLP